MNDKLNELRAVLKTVNELISETALDEPPLSYKQDEWISCIDQDTGQCQWVLVPLMNASTSLRSAIGILRRTLDDE